MLIKSIHCNKINVITMNNLGTELSHQQQLPTKVPLSTLGFHHINE